MRVEIEAELDFEIYSEAGYIWDTTKRRWRSLERNKSGIASVGAAVYSEHPSTEVLCLAYDIKDGRGRRLWIPGMLPPRELFAYIEAGGLVEAHNSGFEFYIWKNVCNARMGWPPLPLRQLRCSMAKARAWSLPGALNKAIAALNGPETEPEPPPALDMLAGIVPF